MSDDPLLCDHVLAAPVSELMIEGRDIIEWYDGPVLATLRCSACGACALLDMLDWDASHRIRVFRVRPLPADALDLYTRNVERGSCDLSRREAELHALLCCAGPAGRLIAYDLDSHSVLANRSFPADVEVPARPWDERLPAAADESWFALAGIPKGRR